MQKCKSPREINQSNNTVSKLDYNEILEYSKTVYDIKIMVKIIVPI